MNLHPKVKASAIAGTVVTVFLAAAPTLGITHDSALALVAAATTIVTFVSGYLKPSV